VREELQGSAVKDLSFPGYIQFNYPPWVTQPEASAGDYPYTPPSNAGRYEPGNVSYVG
jgi:hypothetical protein